MAEEHAHCMTCVNRGCMVRPQPGVSCDLTGCNLVCGAVFHLCKVEEHNLLCPLVRVPCLNSAYGCPANMMRNQISAHLPLCPAGVVCCTMEWNRWPVSCTDYSSYERLSRGVKEAEQLDMALALQDQRTLLESLKLIAITPTVHGSWFSPPDRIVRVTELELSALMELHSATGKERIANGINAMNEQQYTKLYEATVETARSLATALELVSGSNSSDSLAEGVKAEAALQASKLEGLVQLQNIRTADETMEKETSSLTKACLEIVAQDDLVTPQDVVMSPLLQEREPALENHKPQEQIPTPANQWGTKTQDKAVDTSDLEQEDDLVGLGEIDLITAALIFCLEESKDCKRISDTLCMDNGYVHSGTQTFPFPAAVLVTNTRVGDMASASACDHASPQISSPSPFHTLRLSLVLEALKVEADINNYYFPRSTRYQHMFPFVCAQSFRRDEFPSHFNNVHGDIHAGLNGWMEHRCPLAFYGCTFSQRRFYPSAPGAKVVHDRHLRSFGVLPHPDTKLSGDSQSDQFSRLPNEILRHIAGFLDGFSLCQLSLVSRTMREVCACLLKSRGIVELRWERRQDSSGHITWQVKHKVWRFSTAFSPVLRWGFTDVPSMSNHLKKCQYNTVDRQTKPVPLPGLRHVLSPFSTLALSKYFNTSEDS
ncbi:F-box only protein 30-like [Corythoichthys intestinalis]|uniref:F-box only protein 30-like n=1 Tax=Corythoichthys intestinalis TaxID=161448 RepID=UPI0025A5947C|nr:F-box only protein 30-like [Corythoichthys intestinalis]XP_057678227.1 F-box only protein 30-like [Corythoichthys intestinalis]XP_057678229.1 F-box only protein 30-like [Corythoichthys intestinalis]XP_057678230.1 F-box only protein 30-like [Corythoichthys intestinalis]XP_057678231.1 F-box only protein 30-like [Corythoichthys intestinalis]XP_057678232.1 F-box only protein 30-like [Corythoichthys intestinalis]XP_061806705.1 F-box only protein 30-like [Nerophis lumbriciformis]